MCRDGKYLGLGIDKPGEGVYNMIRVSAAHDTARERERKGEPIERWGRKATGPLCNEEQG